MVEPTESSKQSFTCDYPLLSKDFIVQKFLSKREGDLWIFGDKNVDKYVIVPERKTKLIKEILSYFDGKHSIKEIEKIFLEDHKVKIDIGKLVAIFNNAGVIKNSHMYGKSNSEASLLVDLKTINPKKILNPLGSFFSFTWPFWKWLFLLCLFLSFFGGIFLINNRDYSSLIFSQKSVLALYNSYIIGIVVFQLIGFVSMICHELGHLFYSRRLNLGSNGIILSFYGALIPMLRADVKNIYLLDERSRIMFWAMGIITNIFIALLSFIGIIITVLSGFFSSSTLLVVAILWKVIFVNLLIAVGNSIPFLPTDGYFIFSTYFKRPNLRTEIIRKFTGKTKKPLSLTFWTYSTISLFLLLVGIVLYVNMIISATAELYNHLPFSPPINLIIASIIPMVLIYQVYHGLKIIKDFMKRDQEVLAG